MLKNVVQALTLGALFVFLAAGHPLPEDPESSPAAEARADDIAHAVEQVSADGVASPDGSPEAAVVETAAAGAVPGEAAGEVAPSSDGASEVAAAAGGAHGPLVVPLDAGAAPVPHVSGAVSGPGYEHESHQQAARQDAFSEAAQGAQQGSHAAESGEAFKKTEGFENQALLWRRWLRRAQIVGRRGRWTKLPGAAEGRLRPVIRWYRSSKTPKFESLQLPLVQSPQEMSSYNQICLSINAHRTLSGCHDC
ncbi:hypothetical protein V5799_004330 [Amblyomma americanum]|uniref:Secreted protein n=1 Tax=Amblyomma americanum TaxID=6943 RepID=A0AAQ4D6E8_AMBAM